MNDPAESVKAIGNGEHYGITDLEWDPSGRFVVTSASVWRHSVSVLRNTSERRMFFFSFSASVSTDHLSLL